ncbi:MAG TPA: DUF1674 domain-containing protein [Steroidobacteraceae bacterium]|jgi:hypothetical protein
MPVPIDEPLEPRNPPASADPPLPADAAQDAAHPDPTRYGDWEVRGRCIDF